MRNRKPIYSLVKRNKQYGWYVVVRDRLNPWWDAYVHADGCLYEETYNPRTRQYTGYFRTRAGARMAQGIARANKRI